MLSDDGVLEEEGRYRIRLVPDEDAQEPYDDGQSPLLRMDARSGNAEHIQAGSRPANDDERIEEAADRWGTPGDPGWELFERYLKAFYGVTQVEYWYSGSYWYVTYDSAAWREYTGAPPGSADLSEYRAWCEGDCWGWVIEQNTTWVSADDFPDHDSWEDVDSCWGYYGDYARVAALEEWESFMADKREAKAATGEEP